MYKKEEILKEIPSDYNGIYIVPEGIKCIGNSAFKNCHFITGVILPDTVEEIEDLAFVMCDLSSIVLSKNLKKIGQKAFAHSSLKDIVIPDSVTSIGAYAFAECEELNTATLSNNLKHIEKYLFYDTRHLSYVNLPANLEKIDDFAFYGCKWLNYKIPETVKSLGVGSLTLRPFQDVYIPLKIKNLDDKAFDLNFNPSVTAPDEIGKIHISQFVANKNPEFCANYNSVIEIMTMNELIESGKTLKEINDSFTYTQEER